MNRLWDENTHCSSTTTYHSNVTRFGKMENAKSLLAKMLKEHFTVREVQRNLEIHSLVKAVHWEADQKGYNVSTLTDEDIIQQARMFVDEKSPSPNVDDNLATHSLAKGSPDGRAAADENVHLEATKKSHDPPSSIECTSISSKNSSIGFGSPGRCAAAVDKLDSLPTKTSTDPNKDMSDAF